MKHLSTMFFLLLVLSGFPCGQMAFGQCEPEVLDTVDLRPFDSGARYYEVEGDVVYAGYPHGALLTLDISDPARPVRLDDLVLSGVSPSEGLQLLRLSQGVLYARTAHTIYIVDASDPTDLRRSSTLSISGDFTSMAVRGGRLYVGTDDGLQVFDVSDPADPILIAVVAPWGRATIEDVSDSNIVLMVGKFGEFEVYRRVLVDVSDPASPQIVLDDPPMSNVLFRGSRGFEYFSDDAADTVGLNVYDIADASSLQLLGSIEVPVLDPSLSVEDIALQADGDFVYLEYRGARPCAGDDWCYEFHHVRIDVSDPAHMTYEGPVDRRMLGAYAGDIGVGGNIEIFDVTDLSDLVRIGEHFEPTALLDMTFAGESGFALSSRYSPVRLLRLSLADPTSIGIADQPPLVLPIDRLGSMAAGGPNDDYLFVLGYPQGDPTVHSTSLIVNVSDPGDPRIVFERVLAAGENSWIFSSIVSFGDVVAVGSTDGKTVLLDVSDPTGPAPLGEIVGTPVGRSGSMLVVNRSSGMAMVDISNPANPLIVGEAEFGVDVVDGTKAYGLWWDENSGSFGTLFIRCVSLQHPTNPVMLGSVATGATVEWGDLVVRDGLAVLSEDQSRLAMYDLSDPSAPRFIGPALSEWVPYDPVFSPDGTLYTTLDSPVLASVDVASPQSVSFVGSAPSGDTAFGVQASGDLVYLSDYHAGLRVYDVSDAADPYEIGAYETAARAYETRVRGDLAFLAGGEDGLVILDVSDPTSPTPVGSYVTSDLAIALDVEGDFAYIATRFDGLQIIDVSDPSAPALVGSADTPGSAQSVTLAGHLAYVADGTGGVQIIDIADPAVPAIIGSYDTPLSARQVLVRDRTAFVPDRTTGLLALDISDPTSLHLISTLSGLGDTRSVALAGRLAYVADFTGFVHAVDIADPANMQLLQSTPTLGTPRAIASGSSHLYLADGDAGLTILEARPCWYNPCPADLTGDSVLDFFDAQAFLNAYSAHDGLADWNDDGLFDFFDVQAFLNDFAAGCP